MNNFPFTPTRTCVDRFNNRRYYSQISNAIRFPDQNVNNNNQNQTNLNSENGIFNGAESEFNLNNIINNGTFAEAIGVDESFELTAEFKKNYEMWLKEEVYCTDENAIDWDKILKEPSRILMNEIRNSIHYSTYFMKST